MADRPFLILPAPSTAERHKLQPNPPRIRFPDSERQIARVGPKFQALHRAFEAEGARIRGSMSGADPEKALVLETVGTVDDFLIAVQRIPGLEWLLDWDSFGVDPDDDFAWEDAGSDSLLPRRVYLFMASARGLQELESLWKRYKANPSSPGFERGLTKWRDVFRQLLDIRPWGPIDRITDTGLEAHAHERKAMGATRSPVLLELWFRANADTRTAAATRISTVFAAAGGTIRSSAIIPDIGYHAIAGDVPTETLASLLSDPSVALLQSDDVMFVRPLGQALSPLPPPREEDQGDSGALPRGSRREPIVALLDGFPLEHHVALTGAISVHDPDDWAGDCPVGDRVHGTAMASLLVNGDLDKVGSSIPLPVYVRPILKPDPASADSPRYERIPEDEIPVALVYRAVRAMFEPGDEGTPAAPTVRIISLSVADPSRPLDRYPSPWARLLDYLSWKYSVVFVVAAGNHCNALELDSDRTEFDALRAAPHLLEERVLRAILRDSYQRRILCPSESINCLTVGAVHDDGSKPPVLANVIDPYTRRGLPAPYSASGLGFRRAVKPDVVFEGGRQFFREKLGNAHSKATLEPINGFGAPGHRVAAPSKSGGVRHTHFSRGTSDATALVARGLAQAYAALTDLGGEPGFETLSDGHKVLAAKGLLVNACSWGATGDYIASALGLDPNEKKRALTKLLGYGLLDPTRLQGCEGHRATLLGAGTLSSDKGHRFSIPLPPSLSGKAVWRRLAATLTWLSPINCRHDRYRAASLWFSIHGASSVDGNVQMLLRADRAEADWQACRRGTVQHECFVGNEASAFRSDERLEFQVNCRADAGKLLHDIPYALVVTLEVAQDVPVPVYDEVRTRLRAPVGVRSRS